MNKIRLGILAIVVIVLLLTLGFITGTAPGGGRTVQWLASSHGSASYERDYSNVLEVLPNATLRASDRDYRSISELVVLGKVAEVQPGVSRAWLEVDPETGEERETMIALPFNDPTAQSTTVHLVFQITEVIGIDESEVPLVTAGQEVSVGLALGPQVDLEQVSGDFSDLGEIVLFLTDDTRVFDYQPGLWKILEDGAFIGVIDRKGRLTFPAMDPSASAALVPAGLTLPNLRREAQLPERVVEIPG